MANKTDKQKETKPQEPVNLNLRGETITITRVTLTDNKGHNAGHYITSGNVNLTRAQDMLTELLIQSARQEGANRAKTAVSKEGDRQLPKDKGKAP